MKYQCMEQSMYHEDIGEYFTYGIIYNDNSELIVRDVSTNRSYVQYITQLLNVFRASPIHLYNIIEDMLE